MLFICDVIIWLIVYVVIINQTSGVSYNQPKLSPCATWNPNATTFAKQSQISTYSNAIFVNTNNTVFIAARSLYQVQVWPEGSNAPTQIISGGLDWVHTVFVTSNNDIYVDDGHYNKQVKKWAFNTTNSTVVMNVDGICYGLFVDINDTLYCSVSASNKVIKKPMNIVTNTSIIAAGNGTAGSRSDMLNNPGGIFVNINFDLYVADCGNNRIQLFQSGQLNATTVAGNGANGTISLNCPIGIVLDADDYLFITDYNNYRIVGSGPNGFRCLVGCSRVAGSASNQLNNARVMAFDSYGNIFVTDHFNHRVQKFFLATNSCYETTTINAIDPLTSATSPTILITNQNCFPPNVTLIPPSSSLMFPLQFRQNQNVYIISRLQLNCNVSLSIITKWTLIQCLSICSNEIQLDQSVVTTRSELLLPAKNLSYGIYELKLTVTLTISPNMSSIASTYIKIIPSDIAANLVQFGTSMITYGHHQNLTLNPGEYSVVPNTMIFNASDWNYQYYCRIYGVYKFPNINGSLLAIDDSRIDPANPACFSNQSSNRTTWQYSASIISPKSTLTILSGSLPSNQTYQFMVLMTNRRNSFLQTTGYSFVRIDDSYHQLIVLTCMISTMCIANAEYQSINPTTQVALFSICIGNCTTVQNITWNIYQGLMNSTSNIVQWTLFNQMNSYRDIWFFGTNTSNFTAINKLFIQNPHITYWRFEVVYLFDSYSSISALHFFINKPPQNGSCSISPSNGTTSTLFTIICLNWFDEDDIKDYLFYGWTTNPLDRMMLAFSFVSNTQLLLPAANDNTSLLNIVVYIRDTFDCVTEFNISSVFILPDLTEMNDFMNSFQNSTTNSFAQMLASGDQNRISQVVTSLSQQFNQINNQAMETAIANGVSVTTIAISPLGSKTQQISSASFNASALAEYNKELNIYANVRDSLITYATNLPITTAESIKLQASSLVQITQSTNQLTRTTLMLASDKCYQLALNLHSMATKISYDDVQTATSYITQCANNALSAVNGPLQQRTTILDLDLSRANDLPSDYDTDLELIWSNPNLFADKNDFSWETIQKNRNSYYQKQMADKINSQVTETISLITSALKIHLNMGQNLTMNTSSVFLLIETTSIASLSNKVIQQVGDAQIRIPSSFSLSTDDNTSISLRSIMQPLALSDNTRLRSNTNLSTSLSLTILDRNGNEITLRTNVDHPIVLIIPRDPNIVIPTMTFQNVTSFSLIPHHQIFNLHFVNITQSQSNNNLTVSIHFEMHTFNRSLGYLLIYRFDNSPQLNSSINQIDGWSLFCPSNLTNESIYTYFIDNQRTKGHQAVIFGLRELNSRELNNFCLNQSTNTPPISNQPFNFTSNYELRTYLSGCYSLDANNNWQSDGLLVGSRTNHNQTECFSTHLTTFAGGFLVLPSPINWTYVFSNADFIRNKTIYLTVICISILYLLLIIYACYKDKKDIEKLGVTPLPDNNSADQYFYEVLVFTGHRKDAGTKSKVHFIVASDIDETSVRTFADPHRKILQRGGIDAFIMAVPKSLGPLNYLRIWHDNTGKGASASWFLKYIIIRDLQTMEKSYFISQQWFAVEKGDGRIECVLPVAGELQKQEFSYVLSKKAYHSISDGHLWFSIFSRPPSNKFTRVQRCTCCFVLLFITMFLNILYYDQKDETKSTNIGFLYITPEQVSIGIIVELIALVPSLLLVEFFRRIRLNRNKISPLQQAVKTIRSQSENQNHIDLNKKQRWTFPWWCIFLAYGLSFLLVIISIFFIIIRGIEFVLLTQPLKILCLAMFFAFFIRKSDNDQEAAEFLDENRIELNQNEEYLHSIKKKSSSVYQFRANRLDQQELMSARQKCLQELHIRSILREIFGYLFFLILIYVITYSNINSNAFYQVKHLQNFFLNTKQIDKDFTKILTVNEYWNWLENSFVSNVRAQQWYNGELPRNLSGFMNDKSNRLIGWAIMRQLRIKTDLCHTKISSICKYDYSFFNEEKSSFKPGWINQTTIVPNSSIDRAFIYRNGDEIDAYINTGEHEIYNSGGYVYEYRGRLSDIRNNISELHRLNWIDSQTRAVIIQLSLYNPDVQLFTSVKFLIEFLSTGGVFRQSRFEPISFQIFTSIGQLICLVVYMIVIIYFMINEIQWKLRFWSLIDLGIIVCSWTCVGIYIWRYRESIRIGKLFRDTNGYVYINLQLATYVNDIFIFLLGFCCFFGTVKFLRLCRFHRRLSLFTETLRHAGKNLISFSLMFSIVFMAFLTLFYFLFVGQMWSCSTLLHTAQTLFEMILMKFDANELREAAPFLGPFCFSLFILLVVFVCMSMFITIINDAFRIAREMSQVNIDEDHQILVIMFQKLRRWINFGKGNELKIEEERDARMGSEHVDPIKILPKKINQLIEAVNRVYGSQQVEIFREQPARSIPAFQSLLNE